MNISAPFIKRPVMTTFVMLSLFVAGALSYVWLPVTDLPTITSPHIYVSTNYLAASPEIVLNQITIPLEKELSCVKGVREITSTSSQDHSSISLSFDFSKDMNQAALDVQTALNRAQCVLPKGLEDKPTYYLRETNQEPIMDLVITSSEGDVGALRQLTEKYIIPRLERVEGIAQVEVFGEENSIWLRVNPELMESKGITFDQIIEAVKENTSYSPLGSIQTGSHLLSIEWPRSNKDVRDVEEIRVGGVRLKDIAEISDKPFFSKDARLVTAKKSSSALILFIQKTNDANTVLISKEVHTAFDQLRKELPEFISLTIWFDKAAWIQSSLADVEWSLGFSFILVSLVIYCSLKRMSDSLITCVSLPLSLLGTLLVMYLAHFSLDLLSLVALTLSCGFVVDDAIVVLENIVRYREQGKTAREASLFGSEQICFTILSMTLSLVAVFIPILFMPGMGGRLFREFSCTIAIAIMVSGIVSLTITPMLCSRFMRGFVPGSTKESLCKKIYAITLKGVLSYPKIILASSFLCLASSVYLFTMKK